MSSMSNKIDYKPVILKILNKLYTIETANKQRFKAIAFKNAIKNIQESNKAVKTLDDLKDIKGIGKGILKRIEEIIETGELEELKDSNDDIDYINEMMRIHGIGPSKAKELVEEHKIKSIEDLEQNLDLLNDKQKIGIIYYKDFEKRIPKGQMCKHNAYIGKIIKNVDHRLKFEIVGSYRRGAKDSGDIDVIITREDDPVDYDDIIKDIVESFNKDKYLIDTFALGKHKYLGVCRLPQHKTYRRIDILYTRRNEFPFALMYFTGSQESNVIIRQLALSKGFSLSEYGLKHIDGKNKNKFVDYKFNDEQDIFKFLGLKYIPPKNRSSDIDITKYLL